MTTTRVKVKFVFEGWVDVENKIPKKEAKEIVKTSFWACIEKANTSDDRIVDWNIDTLPTNTIVS